MHDLRAKICAKDQFNQSPESSQHDKNSLVQRMWQKVSAFSRRAWKFYWNLRFFPIASEKKPYQKCFTYLDNQKESIYQGKSDKLSTKIIFSYFLFSPSALLDNLSYCVIAPSTQMCDHLNVKFVKNSTKPSVTWNSIWWCIHPSVHTRVRIVRKHF